MLHPLRIVLACALAALTAVTSALAVTGSNPDGDAHPYVGALFADGAVQCSGVLIAPTIVVTAGHCGVDGARVAVSFDTKLDGGRRLLAGTLEVDAAKKSDLAVVVLDAPAPVAPAALPGAFAAESLAKGASITSVGYGYSEPCGRRQLRLRRAPPIGRLAAPPSREVDARALHPDGRAVPRRLRRAAARRRHGRLDHVGRLEGLQRPGRGLPARHGRVPHVPGGLRRASVTTGRAAPL